MTTDREKLLKRIDAFRARHGNMAETTFSRLVNGDPYQLKRLREGRPYSSETVEKIDAFMRSYADGKQRPRSRQAEAAA